MSNRTDIPGVTLLPLAGDTPADYQLLGLDGFCQYNQYKPLADHLFEIVKPKNVFEIGFFFGSSSFCWLSSIYQPRVVSCDVIGDASNNALKVVRNAQRMSVHFNNRLTFIPKSSQFIYDDVKHIPFDFAFIDGRHDYDGVVEDLALCHKLGVRYIYMDDFNREVSRAWAQNFQSLYPPVHGIRFENGAQTSLVDGLLARFQPASVANVEPVTFHSFPSAVSGKPAQEATNAMVLFGEGRTFSRCADAIKKGMIEPFKCDTYLATWESKYHMEDGQTVKDYINLYAPKESLVEKLYEDDEFRPDQHVYTTADHFTEENKTRFLKRELDSKITYSSPGGHRIGAILSMLYQKWRAFKMVEDSPIHYDHVFLCRPDLMVKRVMLPRVPEKNTIYTAPFAIPGSVCDQIAFGDYAAMKAYCSLWEKVDEYAKMSECSFHPETLLSFHLKRCGVKVVAGAFDIEIYRPYHREQVVVDKVA